jgi:uncharacterized protein YfiM (DUF2279 family)
MCLPILGAVLSAGLSIAGAAAEHQAANDAAARQNQAYLDNARAAQTAAVNSYMYQNTRIQQERKATGQQLFEDSVAALKKRGTAYASAGEAGISGLSVDALLSDVFAQEGRQHMATLTQYDMNREKVLSEMEGTRANAEARINSVQRASYPSSASFMIKGLSGAVSALSGATRGAGGLQIPSA